MKRRSLIAGMFVLLTVFAVFFWVRSSSHISPRATGESNGMESALAKKASLDLNYFSKRQIGNPPVGIPWITDLLIVDLDRDGLKDVLVCDGHFNKVTWIRQVSLRVFEENDIGGTVAGPAHVEVADLNSDGHLDVLVAAMGMIPPNNAKIGSVVVLVNDGTNRFTNRVVLENVARVTYATAADLNKDGQLDLVVGAFGYLAGEIRWMENLGKWEFKSHPLLDLSGAIHAPVADLDGDGNLDIVALVSQDSEEVHAFMGNGQGRFRDRVLYGSTNKDYGSSGLSIADVNKDGKPDIVYSNGDGFDYATPGSRPWHGIQWLENLGERNFAFHRVGDFAGAFSPVVADMNGDDHPDFIVSSGFNDWKNAKAVSLMCFENDGAGRFVPRVLAHEPTHLIVVKAADMFNDGRIELVTGAMMFYPPYDRISRVTLWEPKK